MRTVWIIVVTTGLGGVGALPNGPSGDRLYQPPPALMDYLERQRTDLCSTCMFDCNEPQNVPDRTVLDQLDLSDDHDPAECLPACNQYTKGSLAKEVHGWLGDRSLRMARSNPDASRAWSSVNEITAPAVLRVIRGLRCSWDDYHPSVEKKPTPIMPGEERMEQWRKIRAFEEGVRRQGTPARPPQQQQVHGGPVPGPQLPRLPPPHQPPRSSPQLPDVPPGRRRPPSSGGEGPQLPGFLSQTWDQLQQAGSRLRPGPWNMEGAAQSLGHAWTSIQRGGGAAALHAVKAMPQRVPVLAP